MEQPELTALEHTLSSLVPAPAQLNRDRLMYLAGQSSIRGQRWLWCGWGAGIAATVAAIVFVTLMPTKAEPSVRLVYLPAPTAEVPKGDMLAPTDTAPAPSAHAVWWEPADRGYLELERQALRTSLDTLPSPAFLMAGEPPLTQEALRDNALTRPDRPGSSIWEGI
jgi:hypothetical protein